MQMFSTINQSKSLPGFQVVMSLDSINDWLIQTLLRGENDSKQSGEIQANQNQDFYHKLELMVFTVRSSNCKVKIVRFYEFLFTVG